MHKDGEWINQIEGQGQEAGAFSTKDEAQEAGRALAKRLEVEHLIHNEDGTIHERNS